MRVAIVTAICTERDAISAAAASQASLAATLPGVESVDVFTEHLGRPIDVPGHVVHDPWRLLRHPRFRAADVAIFHWGIHGPLFDAMTLLGSGGSVGPAPVLMFHNMTPVELVDEPELRRQLEASRIQLAHLTSLPIRFWTYSQENRRVLWWMAGSDVPVRFVPFPITPPRPLVDRRAAEPIRLVCIGRFARAKGTDVLIEAMGQLVRSGAPTVGLELIGNPAFSYPSYVAQIDRRIAELGLEYVVSVSSDVDDNGLWDRLERAHILVSPSRHEGLCVPVVEAYLAGCRVVAADGGNLPFIVQPPDPVVAANDPGALAAALRTVIDDVVQRRPIDRSGADAVVAAYGEECALTALAAALAEISTPDASTDVSWPPIIGSASSVTRQRPPAGTTR